MAEDLIIFEPASPVHSSEAKRMASIYYIVLVVAALIGINGFRKYDKLPVLSVAIGSIALIVAAFQRTPTRLLFNTRLKLLKVDYLDALGREKSLYIDLTKANFKKTIRGRFMAENDQELVIYQNIFTSYIAVNKFSRFSESQLDQMFTLIKTLKENAG